MKKFFAILLTVCMISALFVMPASASIFDTIETLDLSGDNIISFDVMGAATSYVVSGSTTTQFTDYPVSNLLDGDENTTAILSYGGHATRYKGLAASNCDPTADVYLASSFVIDLGEAYTISGLSVTYPTSAQLSAINTTYSTYVNQMTTAAASGVYGQIYFYKENPATSSETPFTCKSGNTFNNTFNYDSSNQYRYIEVTGTWCNFSPVILNELEVNVSKEAVADSNGYKYADFYHGSTSFYADETYPMSNLFDGSTDTHALLALRNTSTSNCNYSYRVIDLGEEKTITKLNMTIPSDYASLLEAVGVTTHTANYCQIFGYQNEPALTHGMACSVTPLNTDASGISLCSGQLKTQSVDVAAITSTPIRYLLFWTSMAGYPGMLSELEVIEDDREGSVSFETTAAVGEAEAVTYDVTNSTGSWTVVGEHPSYPISNIFDSDPETIGWMINRDTNGTHRGITITIDLGKDTQISAIDWTFPSSTEGDAIMKELGYTVTGGSAEQQANAVNSWDGTGCSISGVSDDGTVSNKLTVYGTIGTADWRKATQYLGEDYAYRYIKISGAQNYTMLLSDFSIKDIDGNELIGSTKEVVRFYVAPTLTSKFYDTESFGMYIVPFDLLDTDAPATDSVMMSMDGEIVTGQNYAADLSGIPSEAADTSIAVLPFVVLDGDYFYGNAAQFTLNGLK